MVVRIIKAPYVLCIYPIPYWTSTPEAYGISSFDGTGYALILCATHVVCYA
jgi:hypothetical protein